MNKLKFFLTLSVIGLFFIVVGGFLLTAGRMVGQSVFGRSFAEGQLKDYVMAVMRQDLNGSRCQAVDSDKNGYVSCDYTTSGQPSVPRSIECAAWGLDGFLNRGCKARPVFESR